MRRQILIPERTPENGNTAPTIRIENRNEYIILTRVDLLMTTIA